MPRLRRHDTSKETKTLRMSNTELADKPLFLLAGKNGDYTGKCYCAACQKVSEIPGLQNASTTRRGQLDIDVECPECHNDVGYIRLDAISPRNPQRDENHISYDGAWDIPMIPNGRYLFDFTDENGDVTRIEDNIVMHCATVFPSGESYQYNLEYSEATDLVNDSVKVTKTKIEGDKRTELKVFDSLDTFQYPNPKKTFSPEAKWTINHAHTTPSLCFGLVPYNVLYRDFDNMFPESRDGRPSSSLYFYPKGQDYSYFSLFYKSGDENSGNRGSSSIRASYNSNGDIELSDEDKAFIAYKTKAIMSRFSDNPAIDPVYLDTFNNGLFLKEHHVGSNEGNTPTDENLRVRYLLLAAKYPVAFEYACERANDRITNWQFKEKRKAAADPSYEAKETAPDSFKAQVFRNELEYIAEQLSAVDDKILATIESSKDVADMKKQLAFYAFGKDGQYTKAGDTSAVPKQIKLGEEGTMQDAVESTKKLKSMFNSNPIATASTVYTCQKLGIRDVNHIAAVLDIADASPDVHKNRHKRRGETVYYRDKPSRFRNADVIMPVQEGNLLSFLKSYSNFRRNADFIKDIYDEEAWVQLIEDVRIYADVKQCAKLTNDKNQLAVHHRDVEKSRLREYLRHKSIQDAYLDFVDVYEDKTKRIIDTLAYQVHSDNKLAQMKKDFDEGGLSAVKEKHATMLEHFPPYCDSSDESKDKYAKNPDDYITRFFTNYEPVGEESKVVIATRNGKPLFLDRSLRDIHDELNHMNNGLQSENKPISYNADEKALESEYQATDSENENDKWTFSLHKDTNEMIRTASELHNCLKSHTNEALRKYETLLFLRNELGEKVACISLRKNRGGHTWECDECQGDHDTAIHERYKDVINQWCEDHDIVDGPKRNLRRMGERDSHGNLISFYGVGADYHHEEIDETTGAVVDIRNMQDIVKKRREKAKEVYGVDAAGNINLPEAMEIPDYLS